MKKRRTRLFFAALLVFTGFFCNQSALFAQDTDVTKLSLEEAVELALKNNFGLESVRLETAGKKRASDTRWNAFIPTATVGGQLSRTNKTGVVSGFAPVDLAKVPGLTLPPNTVFGVVPYSVDRPEWTLAASLQLSLSLGIATFADMKKIKLDYETGLISYEKARLQLERDIRKAYYQILLAGESIKLLNASLANAERRVVMAQANYRAGLIPEVSLLQARVAVENLRPSINEAENGYKMAMASFAIYLGLPYDAAFELADPAETVDYIPLDTAGLTAKAAAEKPEIQELKKQLQSLKSARQSLFYKLYTPTLQLGWGLVPAFMDDPMKASWFDGDKWNDTGSFSISLGFSLNGLIPFTKENNALKDLDDSLKVMNLRLAQAVQGTEVEVYNIVLQLEKTRTQAEAQKFTVELAERTLNLSERAYRSGLKEFLDVQNDELALRQARLNMLQQNFAYLTGLLDLEYAIGVPFGTLGRN